MTESKVAPKVEATPTPGPWSVEGNQIAAMHPCYVVGATGHNGPIYIATIEPANAPPRHRCTEPGESAASNAYLIAAAPELLECLREAIDTVQGLYDPADDDDPVPAVLARWRAALAKAGQP